MVGKKSKVKNPSRATKVKLYNKVTIPDNAGRVFDRKVINPDDFGCSSTEIAGRFARHPLISNRYFFGLPPKLLDAAIQGVGRSKFGSDELDLEHDVSRICEDFSNTVGVYRGHGLTYSDLAYDPSIQMTWEQAQECRLQFRNEEEFDRWKIGMQACLLAQAKNRRAYLGWLLTNKQFIQEHDQIILHWEELLRVTGFVGIGSGVSERYFSSSVMDSISEERLEQCHANFSQFFGRWRINGLAAPYLPKVLSISASVTPPIPRLHNADANSVFLTIPDIMPVPSRDTLRSIIDDVLATKSDRSQLEDWLPLVSIRSRSSRELERTPGFLSCSIFGFRSCPVTEPKTHRCVNKLKIAFAEHFHCDLDVIHGDIARIRTRLGKEWEHRGVTLSIGPFSVPNSARVSSGNDPIQWRPATNDEIKQLSAFKSSIGNS